MFRHCNPIYWPLIAVLANILPGAHLAHAVAYTVGGDANCTHGSLQDAIDDVPEGTPGHTIHVANSASYTQVALTIDNRNIAISGGYAHCGDANPGSVPYSTLLDGGSNGAHSVIKISGAANVQLQDFYIQNGSQGNDSHGGGINYTGHGSLTMNTVGIVENHCGYGGGVNVSPDGNADITLGSNMLIENNTAAHEGGGIRIEGSTVLHINSSGTLIGNNSAGDYGGGLHVIGPARADIGSSGRTATSSLTAVFYQNVAGSGGAIAAVTNASGNDAMVRLFSTDPDHPPRLLSNRASNHGGGGVYLLGSSGAHARLCADDFSFEYNAAPDGSAIMADENGSNGSMIYLNRLDDPDHVCLAAGALPGAVRCTPGASCNDVSINTAEDSSNNATDGAALWVREAGRLLADKVRITGNSGGSALRISTNEGAIADADAHTCLITDNHVSTAVIRSEGNSPLGIHNCTIANNIVGAPSALLLDDDYTIERSIIWQPGVTTITETDNGSTELTRDVFKSDIFGCTPTAGCTVPPVGDSPRFVDPVHGDYHLQAASQAVDYTATVDGTDLDGLPRGVDLAAVPNFHGPADLGAFERQSLGNLVLNGSFDQDLHIWTNVASGNYAVAFDATLDYQNMANSGSAKVTFTPTGGGSRTEVVPDAASDVPILTQCIALPNYGDYTLTAYDRRFGMLIAQNTTASIEWSEYDTSFNCSGTPNNQGQLFLPYNNPAAWRMPTTPAEVHAGSLGHSYAHNASVAVTLTFHQPVSSAATASFDAVSLTPGFNDDTIFANGFEP